MYLRIILGAGLMLAFTAPAFAHVNPAEHGSFVEPVILTSVVVLGLLVALAVRLPVAMCAMLVAGFALFHGHAHGAELGNAGALVYGAGFVVATTALHALGVGLGIALSKAFAHTALGDRLSRVLGAGTAVAGVVLLLG